MKPTCILKGIEITPENDSKAHVIPSALGGTLKPRAILCQEANAELNNKFDYLLIRSLHPIMALLGGVPDRGIVQPTKMLDANGKEVLVVFGESITLGAPEFSEAEDLDGTKRYSIKARTMKEARTLLGRVKKTHPFIQVDDVMAQASVVHTYLSRPLTAKLEIGPASTFPAIFSMAAIYSTHCGVQPHPDFNAYVSSFPEDSEGTDAKIPMPPDTFYWLPSPPPFEDSEAITHRMFLVACPSKGEVLFYVELFNLICVGVKFPYSGTARLSRTYGVDVIAGTEIQPVVDESSVFKSTWAATHQLSDNALDTQIESRMARILKVAHGRSQAHEINRIIAEEIGIKGTTSAAIGRVSERLASMLAAQLRSSDS